MRALCLLLNGNLYKQADPFFFTSFFKCLNGRLVDPMVPNSCIHNLACAHKGLDCFPTFSAFEEVDFL